MAAPIEQAPQWVRDLLPSAKEEAAADREQAALLGGGRSTPETGNSR
jgi:hypothetical protein